MLEQLSNWLSGHWVEITAALISLVYVILSVRQIRWLWLFGFLSAVLYSWIYFDAGFYAGMGLQGYYMFISIYGWILWSRGRGAGQSEVILKVTRVSWRTGLYLMLAWSLLLMAISLVLKYFTDSTIPFWDALTTSGGIIATWMLARKILENWVVWIFVDSVSIILYLWKGLYPTAILFAVYVVMAFIGIRAWHKSIQQ
ncbi:MAG: nicotinamide riboside transporter PnuC [Bacteroidales bacterium]